MKRYCNEIIKIGKIVTVLVLVTLFMNFYNSAFCQTYVSGSVSGIWEEKDSPYIVSQSDIVINYSDTLIIRPGVEVIFNTGGLNFKVYGALLAEGTSDSLIYFKGILNNPGIWGNIYFVSNSDINKLRYCCIQDAGHNDQAAINFNTGNLEIANCLIINNKSLGIEQSSSHYLKVVKCDIVLNGGTGISIYSSPEINSNIIAYNGEYALYFRSSSGTPIVRHNCFWENQQGNFSDYVRYHPGFGSVETVNVNGDSCDANYNLYLDPQFIDYNNDDFSIINTSPCINAADLLLTKDPDGSFADIGAFSCFEPTHVVQENNQARTFHVCQNYPNPFNPSTTINYSLPERGFVSITIYNIIGQKVVTLLEKEQLAGNYSVIWSGRDTAGQMVPSGLYFYQIQAGGFTRTMKMSLVK